VSEQDTRLTIAELKLAAHDKLHEEAQMSMKILSDGISQLVQAEIRRENDSATFERMFAAIKKIEDSFSDLKEDFDDYKQKISDKELADYKSIVWKVIGLAAVVMASVIAGHLGGKWLG
jgi:hypothetical protein